MSAEVALRPSCPACGTFMELRNPPGGWTPEQRFCGTWYDHPPIAIDQCTSGGSVLYPSRELTAQLEEMAVTS